MCVAAAACRKAAPPSGAAGTPAPPERRSPARSAAGEGLPTPDHLDRVLPPEHPNQRLAFSRERLAWLDGDELRVFELADFSEATRFPVTDARNVAGLTGGGFLIAGR